MFISYDKTCISAVSSHIIVKKNHSVCQLFKFCCTISQAASVHNNIVKLAKKFKKLKFSFYYFIEFTTSLKKKKQQKKIKKKSSY